MKKSLFIVCLMAMVFTAKAQQKEPNIVITFKESDKTVELAIGGQKGDEFQIDWGDGKLQTYNKAAYYSETLKSKTVKIYGEKVMILRARKILRHSSSIMLPRSHKCRWATTTSDNSI